MMKLLLSNIPPVRPSNEEFRKCFERFLEKSDHLNIASGYISTDALTEIKRIIEFNKRPSLDLVIGMHHFDGFTRTQYESALYLNEFLTDKGLGGVFIVTTFRFHGKLYTFSKESGVFGGIVGSSNLTNILDNHHVFETDILIEENSFVEQVNEFITDLRCKASVPFSEYAKPERFNEPNKLLEDHERVGRCTNEEKAKVLSSLTNTSFDIPIKTESRSNLNVYFGKGRKNKRGFVKPRHWYEVELIVPKKITSEKDYPKAGTVFTVITDDGWKFDCKISGDYSKNFRSEDDLKILGKWMKGRLENGGALSPGQMVTADVLSRYGRNNFKLTKTSIQNVWYLNFGAE